MARIEIEMTAEQARVVRNAFLPLNPNKLRGAKGRLVVDGVSLADLAKRVIAALESAKD